MCLRPGQSFEYTLIRVAHVACKEAWKSENLSDFTVSEVTQCDHLLNLTMLLDALIV